MGEALESRLWGDWVWLGTAMSLSCYCSIPIAAGGICHRAWQHLWLSLIPTLENDDQELRGAQVFASGRSGWPSASCRWEAYRLIPVQKPCLFRGSSGPD